MDFGSINWLAVIVCVVVSMVSGTIWYNPKTFFPMWWKVVGAGKEQPGMENMGMTWGSDLAFLVGAGNFPGDHGQFHGRSGCHVWREDRLHALVWLYCPDLFGKQIVCRSWFEDLGH